VKLPDSEALHATRVLRLPAGAPVTLFDGEGGEFTGILEFASRTQVSVRVQSHRKHPRPAAEVTLIQAVAKGPAMDGLVHRAVELGCHRLVPVVTDRSVSRPEAAEERQAKWQAIAVEAAKQSGNPWRMKVEPPRSLSVWLARAERFELALIASLLDSPCHLRAPFDAFHQVEKRLPRTVAVIVGPEGDFTAAEYAAFQSAGARSVTLGPYVLRVETAATAALAIIQSRMTEA